MSESVLSFGSTRRVEQLFAAVLDLDRQEKDELFRLLQTRFSFRFEREQHSDFERPWLDPRNGFGKMQSRLLQFLDGNDGQASEELVIAAVYRAGVGSTAPAEYRTLCARLRQLECDARRNFRKLKLDWEIGRKKAGQLELKRLQCL